MTGSHPTKRKKREERERERRSKRDGKGVAKPGVRKDGQPADLTESRREFGV